MDASTDGLVVAHGHYYNFRFVHYECLNRWTCCYTQTLLELHACLTRWMLQQMDFLFAYSQPCTLQFSTAADGLVGVARHHLYLSVGHRSKWTCLGD